MHKLKDQSQLPLTTGTDFFLQGNSKQPGRPTKPPFFVGII